MLRVANSLTVIGVNIDVPSSIVVVTFVNNPKFFLGIVSKPDGTGHVKCDDK